MNDDISSILREEQDYLTSLKKHQKQLNIAKKLALITTTLVSIATISMLPVSNSLLTLAIGSVGSLTLTRMTIELFIDANSNKKMFDSERLFLKKINRRNLKNIDEEIDKQLSKDKMIELKNNLKKNQILKKVDLGFGLISILAAFSSGVTAILTQMLKQGTTFSLTLGGVTIASSLLAKKLLNDVKKSTDAINKIKQELKTIQDLNNPKISLFEPVKGETITFNKNAKESISPKKTTYGYKFVGDKEHKFYLIEPANKKTYTKTRKK
jgi:hypothetical protein